MELNFNSMKNYSFKFMWEDSIHTTMVEINLPDVSQLEYSVGGDWGPMYTFHLIEREPIKIKYNNIYFESPQKHLTVISPMLAAERQAYPYFLVVEDTKRNLCFYLYLNRDHQFAKVQIIRSKDGIRLYESHNENYLQNVI